MDDERVSRERYAKWASMRIDELARDCDIQAFRASGPGGQGVNTTDSAVRMRHVPSGIVVTARESRSQFQNRASCLRKLKEELARRARPSKKRVATKPGKAAKARRLADKRHRARIKAARRRYDGSE